MFFPSENFGKIFSLTEFSDDIEVIFGFKNALEFEQILRGDVLDFFKNVDLVVGKLAMQIVFLLNVNNFDSHELVGLVVFAFVDMGTVAEADLV